jgi:predicted metal-binding membrane protein
MAGMAGTMGLGLAAFVPVWTLMMAPVMLPSVAPTASLYACLGASDTQQALTHVCAQGRSACLKWVAP